LHKWLIWRHSCVVSELILASSSSYRAQLLQRFKVPFKAVNPAIDESPLDSETAPELVLRLAIEKAQAVASENNRATVIGSDQVCVFDDEICGKPHHHDIAVKQLERFSGGCIDFFTGLCVISQSGDQQTHIDQTRVIFRTLSKHEIERYLNSEQPYDCAGAFKVESMGLSLFDAVKSDDPSALMGLPLITTAQFLREVGYAIP